MAASLAAAVDSDAGVLKKVEEIFEKIFKIFLLNYYAKKGFVNRQIGFWTLGLGLGSLTAALDQ